MKVTLQNSDVAVNFCGHYFFAQLSINEADAIKSNRSILSMDTSPTGPNVIKLFISVFFNFHNKLQCLSSASLSSLV